MSNKTQSAEIRWFFKGQIPKIVEEWFKSSVHHKFQETREDIYLLFPGSSCVGVKIREENFEIKPLLSDLGEYTLNEDATGKIEVWEKWKTMGDSGTHFIEIAKGSADWLKVKKEKMLRKFTFFNSISEINPDLEIEDGCSLELTRILINDINFWTLGFEAYEKKGSGVEIVKGVAKKIMNEEIPLQFELENGVQSNYSIRNSCSYPAFLLVRNTI
jgi:hypothetical protein